MSEISIWILHSGNGQLLATVDQYESLEYTRVTNGVGAFSLVLPPWFDRSLLLEDNRVVIWRKPPGGTRQIDFCGFIRSVQHNVDTQETITVSGCDLNYLLDSRIVAYGNDSATHYANKTGYADDMMKEIVSENLGSTGVDAQRDLTAYGFSVEPDYSRGTILAASFAWRNVLLTLQDIADSSHSTETTSVYFGITPLKTGWECVFQTRILQWGLDRRLYSGANPLILSAEFGNLGQIERTYDWRDERTFSYAGGQGEGLTRPILFSSDQLRLTRSPFNRREVFKDGRSVTTSTELQDIADEAVREGRPRNTMTGILVNTKQYVYGRDYGFGDYVTAVYLGERIECRIDSVDVSINRGVENLEVGLRAEL